MREATARDPKLSRILEEKRKTKKSTATSKGPFKKLWKEVHKRDRIFITGNQLIVPRSLQAQAITITHEGHQQNDGMLRQTQIPCHLHDQDHKAHEA